MSKNNQQTNHQKIFKMVCTAVLIALIVLMTFTGVGYIPIGPLKLTLNTLPVAIAAVFLGPTAGTIVGLVFGLSSFFTCFGMDVFGSVLLQINPFLCFVVCVAPRILCGLLPALIFKGMSKFDKTKIFASAVSCTLTAVINTVGFLSLMWLCFAGDLMSNPDVIAVLGGTGISSIVILFASFAGTNAIIEAAVNLVLGTAICKALFATTKKIN